MEPYYTIIIPFVPPEFATEWHPIEPDGPFSKLTRGCFKSTIEAITWGRTRLGGTPYEIKLVEDTIVVAIEHDVSFNVWRVTDDGEAFESATFYSEAHAIDNAKARTGYYLGNGHPAVRTAHTRKV